MELSAELNLLMARIQTLLFLSYFDLEQLKGEFDLNRLKAQLDQINLMLNPEE